VNSSATTKDALARSGTGVGRRGYTVGGLLWVGGLLAVVIASYTAVTRFNESVEDLPFAPTNEVTGFEVDEAGEQMVWVEQAVRDRAGPYLGSEQSPDDIWAQDLAAVEVRDPGGAAVSLVYEPSVTLRTTREGLAVVATAYGSFQAVPGRYEVSVLSGEAAVRGVVVGPKPDNVMFRWGIGGLILALVGAVTTVVTLALRGSRRTGASSP